MSSAHEIDPAIFRDESTFEFEFALTTVASDYCAALGIIDAYDRANSPEAKRALREQITELPQFKQLQDLLGEDSVDWVKDMALGAVAGVDDESAAREDYELARANREASAALLTGYVFGYQGFLSENPNGDYGDDEDRATAASWQATWQKLRDILRPMGGTTLAEVVDYFDGMIRYQYAATYDPSEKLRGPEVSQDTSARAFYETMEAHLGRSIIGRRSGDEWSGK